MNKGDFPEHIGSEVESLTPLHRRSGMPSQTLLTKAPIQPALVICCKDYRYIQPIQRFVKRRLGIRWYDLKATAGGVRAMLESPRIVRQWILRDIDLVYRLHCVRRVILVHHEDCAAYGGSTKLGSLAKQRRFHRTELRRAARVLRRQFPDLTIHGFMASGYPAAVRIVPILLRV